MKGINVIGIAVGIYPCEIKNLFPSLIYSKNPYKIIQGIDSCFSGVISGKMERIKSEFNFRFTNKDIKELQEKPKNKKLKTLLSRIIVDFFSFIMGEIPKDTVEKELLEDGKYSIGVCTRKIISKGKIIDNYALYLWND